MRTLAIALSFLVLGSFGAAAQKPVAPAPVPPPVAAPSLPAAPSPSLYDSVTPGKVIAVGVGALIGVAVVPTVIGGESAAIVGGIAGGLIGAWWYGSADGAAAARVDVRPTAAREAANRGETTLVHVVELTR